MDFPKFQSQIEKIIPEELSLEKKSWDMENINLA